MDARTELAIFLVGLWSGLMNRMIGFHDARSLRMILELLSLL